MFIVYSTGIGFELVSSHHSTAAQQANRSFNPLSIYYIPAILPTLCHGSTANESYVGHDNGKGNVDMYSAWS